MKKIKFWFMNARPVALPQSMVPAFVAVMLAAKYADFRWYLALFCLAGVAFAHLSLNLFDDYFDYRNAKQGDRSALAREGFRAQTVKCPYLQDGTVTPGQWLAACIVFGGIACAFGLPVLIARGLNVLWVVLGVAALGLFYSAPPLKLGYRGLGELIIGMIFGPALGIGTAIGASGEFHASEVLLSCAWGLLVVNILYVHSIMDFAADTKAGKKTLAWLVSPKSGGKLVNKSASQYVVLGLICFVPYVLVGAGAILNIIPPWYLLVFLSLPWTVSLFKSMLDFRKDPFGKTEKKWWYGHFMLWERIKEEGIDWFMLRWLLAQKINTFFSILLIIGTVVVLAGF